MAGARELTGVYVTTDMVDFLRSIGPVNCKIIRSIQIHVTDILSISHPKPRYLSGTYLGHDVEAIIRNLNLDEWLGTLGNQIHQPPPAAKIQDPAEMFVLWALLDPTQQIKSLAMDDAAGWVGFMMEQGRNFSLPAAYRSGIRGFGKPLSPATPKGSCTSVRGRSI